MNSERGKMEKDFPAPGQKFSANELMTSPVTALGSQWSRPGAGLHHMSFRGTHAGLLNQMCFRQVANCRTPQYLAGLDQKMRPRYRSQQSLHFSKDENNLIFNMLLLLRAHVVVLQEAWTLQDAVKFLEEDSWFCSNDWKNLAVVARLAPGGCRGDGRPRPSVRKEM